MAEYEQFDQENVRLPSKGGQRIKSFTMATLFPDFLCGTWLYKAKLLLGWHRAFLYTNNRKAIIKSAEVAITFKWWHSCHTNQHFVEGSLIFIILFVLVLFDFRCRLHCRSCALNLPFLIAGEGDSARVSYCFSIKLLVSSLYKLWMVEFSRNGNIVGGLEHEI